MFHKLKATIPGTCDVNDLFIYYNKIIDELNVSNEFNGFCIPKRNPLSEIR